MPDFTQFAFWVGTNDAQIARQMIALADAASTAPPAARVSAPAIHRPNTTEVRLARVFGGMSPNPAQRAWLELMLGTPEGAWISSRQQQQRLVELGISTTAYQGALAGIGRRIRSEFGDEAPRAPLALLTKVQQGHDGLEHQLTPAARAALQQVAHQLFRGGL